MQKLIYINRKDIAGARPGVFSCPIARALTRREPPPAGWRWHVNYTGGAKLVTSDVLDGRASQRRYSLTTSAERLMHEFDESPVVGPKLRPRHIRLYIQENAQ